MLLGIQPNVPILLLTKLLAYDQAQANTFVIQFMNILKLAKFFENQFLIFFADPFACILDFDQNFLVSLLKKKPAQKKYITTSCVVVTIMSYAWVIHENRVSNVYPWFILIICQVWSGTNIQWNYPEIYDWLIDWQLLQTMDL